MKALPKHRDPEVRLHLLNRAFQRVSRRHARAARLRRLSRWAKMSTLAVIGGAVVYGALAELSHWPPMVTLRHIAAFPICDAARAVGLAPANRGEPGYWSRHDDDGDGTACETMPRR